MQAAAILAQPNTPFRIKSETLFPPRAGEALLEIDEAKADLLSGRLAHGIINM